MRRSTSRAAHTPGHPPRAQPQPSCGAPPNHSMSSVGSTNRGWRTAPMGGSAAAPSLHHPHAGTGRWPTHPPTSAHPPASPGPAAQTAPAPPPTEPTPCSGRSRWAPRCTPASGGPRPDAGGAGEARGRGAAGVFVIARACAGRVGFGGTRAWVVEQGPPVATRALSSRISQPGRQACRQAHRQAGAQAGGRPHLQQRLQRVPPLLHARLLIKPAGRRRGAGPDDEQRLWLCRQQGRLPALRAAATGPQPAGASWRAPAWRGRRHPPPVASLAHLPASITSLAISILVRWISLRTRLSMLSPYSRLPAATAATAAGLGGTTLPRGASAAGDMRRWCERGCGGACGAVVAVLLLRGGRGEEQEWRIRGGQGRG